MLKGSPFPVPGFWEQLEGLEKGQEKEFSISLPDDHEPGQFEGKEYRFKVLVSEIKEKNLLSLMMNSPRAWARALKPWNRCASVQLQI